MLAIIAIIVVVTLVSVTLLSAKPIPPESIPNEKITVLASFYPLYEFGKIVGGQNIAIDILVRDGLEPHDWDPSIKDIINMQNADLILINGVGFENWIDKFSQMDSDTIIVDTSTGIQIIDSSDDGTGDPHIWLDPVLVKSQVQNISDVLKELDPKNTLYYQTNADNYILQLDLLDDKIHNQLSGCSRDFITYHDAFSYFADQYDLNQHTIVSSDNPHIEPTPQTFQNIIKLSKDLDIDVIFAEDITDQRALGVIAKEINGTVLVLSPVEVSQNDSSYIGQMEQNLSNLKEALCQT